MVLPLLTSPTRIKNSTLTNVISAIVRFMVIYTIWTTINYFQYPLISRAVGFYVVSTFSLNTTELILTEMSISGAKWNLEK